MSVVGAISKSAEVLFWDQFGAVGPDARSDTSWSILVDACIPFGGRGVFVSSCWMAELFREQWLWWVHGVVPHALSKRVASSRVSAVQAWIDWHVIWVRIGSWISWRVNPIAELSYRCWIVSPYTVSSW